MAEVRPDEEDFTMETRDASPAHLLIKIESFSSLSESGIEKYESRDFEAGDYKWRLIIRPDGLIKSENGDSHISVYLAIVKSSSMTVGWEVNATFSIFLYNQILDNYLCFQVMKAIHPYKREWKISEFSKLGEVWNSEEFTAGNKKWMFILYPNGEQEEKGRSVSMFLKLVDRNHEKVKAGYCLRIKNQLNDQHHSQDTTHWFTSSSDSSWGWPAFIPLSDMRDPNKGLLVKNCCCVEIEISVKLVVRDES